MTGHTARFPAFKFPASLRTISSFKRPELSFLDLKIIEVFPPMGLICSVKERFAVAGVGAAGAVYTASFLLYFCGSIETMTDQIVKG